MEVYLLPLYWWTPLECYFTLEMWYEDRHQWYSGINGTGLIGIRTISLIVRTQPLLPRCHPRLMRLKELWVSGTIFIPNLSSLKAISSVLILQTMARLWHRTDLSIDVLIRVRLLKTEFFIYFRPNNIFWIDLCCPIHPFWVETFASYSRKEWPSLTDISFFTCY